MIEVISRLCLYKKISFVVAFVAFVFCYQCNAQPAAFNLFEGGFLYIPNIYTGFGCVDANLEETERSETEIQYVLNRNNITEKICDVEPPSVLPTYDIENNDIVIPMIMFNDKIYRIELRLLTTGPVTFQLILLEELK